MDAPLFLSLYGLFNLYIYFMAYLYAPATINAVEYDESGVVKRSRDSGRYDIQEAEKER